MSEKSEADKVSEELAKQYEDAGKEVDEAVEANREETEKFYAEQREADEARERELRNLKAGSTTDAVGNPTSGPGVAKSAAGPVEEVSAERSAEGADAENPDAAEEKTEEKSKPAAKKSAAKKS
jgi:hypothetical protein